MATLIRLFDLLVSGFLLIVTAPVFVVVGVLIKLDSPGPVFFVQERVGRGWRRFGMLKFRKMHERVCGGPGVTGRFDPRVTRVGAWLERTKLDELPQLVNVLLGQMSLVGPRPELPRFTGEPYRALWDRVLSVKPGIFGPNQIRNRNESELFPEGCEDMEAYYVQHILPRKLEVDAAYAGRKSLAYDAWILLCGFWVSVAGAITRDTVRTRRWQVAHLAACVVLGELTLAAAFVLRFDWRLPSAEVHRLLAGLVLMGAARLAVFAQFRVHRSIHTYFSLSDAMRILGSVTVGTVLGIAVQMLLNLRALSRSVFVVDGLLLAVVLIGLSYVVDWGLELWRRNHVRGTLRSVSEYVFWGSAAGCVGVVSAVYAMALLWPGVFVEYWLRLLGVLGAFFASRVILFSFLLYRLPLPEGFVGTVVRRARPLAAHVALVFIADVTAVFFLNVRDFSRGTLVLSASFYAVLLLGLMAVRGLGRKSVASGQWSVVGGSKAGSVAGGQRIVVIGDGRETGLLVSAIRHAGQGDLSVVGVVTEKADFRTRQVEGVEVIGTTGNLGALLEAKGATVALVLRDTISGRAFRSVVRACRTAGVGVRVVPGVREVVGGWNGRNGQPSHCPLLGRERGASGVSSVGSGRDSSACHLAGREGDLSEAGRREMVATGDRAMVRGSRREEELTAREVELW